MHVCVVFYGHPTVFAQPGLDAAIYATKIGYDVKILPGISAEDCLFADLMIDPGTIGCQSFEATDFLIHKRKFDNSSHLILWQVDAIGILDNLTQHDYSSNLKYLVNYLNLYYDLSHKVVLYQSSQYPSFKPRIEKVFLGKLAEAKLTSIVTLYLPPGRTSVYDENVIKDLKIKIEDLRMNSCHD